MTTEAVKQDKNNQIAETGKQHVCSGTYKPQRELTIRIWENGTLAILSRWVFCSCPSCSPWAKCIVERAGSWLAWPLWERARGHPNSSSTTTHPLQTWPFREPMQLTTQLIYFFFFFFLVSYPLIVVSWTSWQRGQGSAEGGESRGVHNQQESREQKLPFCDNQAGSSLPQRQSLPASVAISWSAERTVWPVILGHSPSSIHPPNDWQPPEESFLWVLCWNTNSLWHKGMYPAAGVCFHE